MESFKSQDREVASSGQTERRVLSEHFGKTVRAMVAAFMLTIPANTEAAEFKDTSWSGGLKTMIEQVFHSYNEHAGLAILFSKGGTKWFNGQEGSMDTMSSGNQEIDDLTFTIDTLQAKLVAGSSTEEKVVNCVTHTHPEHLHTKQHHHSYLYGPSFGDLQHLVGFKHSLDEYGDAKVNTESFGLALGRDGGWYFDVVAPDLVDQATEAQRIVVITAQVKFKRLLDGEKTTAGELADAFAQLELAYASVGAVIRLSPYGALEQEPPCAGPYYEPPAVGSIIQK